MPLDVLTVSALRDELSQSIVPGRIEKVQQPERDLIIFTVKDKSNALRRLLISVNLSSARVHFTNHAFENPAVPPMFCMFLRKHLTGAVINGIEQPEGERILIFKLKTYSVSGDISEKHLIIELFGRIPNVILTDDGNMIIDCMRRVGGNMDSKRMILPALRYMLPEPPVNKRQSTAGGADSGTGETGDEINEISISEKLDVLYTQKTKEAGNRDRCAFLTKTVKTAYKRVSKKLEAQKAELENAKQCEYYRKCGDIITANLHLMKKGSDILTADDFFSDNTDGNSVKCEIPLDPMLSPQKNAAKYYKRYKKAKNAAVYLTQQIKKAQTELEYLESILEQLARTESMQEIDEIREELAGQKYIKNSNSKQKQTKNKEAKPSGFTSSAGMQVYVGKNNTQNDKLTFKTAAKTDLWLHAQKKHGAHVIVKTGGKMPDDTTLKEAAEAAAYYSQARQDNKAAVDYTFVKHVRKPPGAMPGMVIYTDYKTITVNPGNYQAT